MHLESNNLVPQDANGGPIGLSRQDVEIILFCAGEAQDSEYEEICGANHVVQNLLLLVQPRKVMEEDHARLSPCWMMNSLAEEYQMNNLQYNCT